MLLICRWAGAAWERTWVSTSYVSISVYIYIHIWSGSEGPTSLFHPCLVHPVPLTYWQCVTLSNIQPISNYIITSLEKPLVNGIGKVRALRIMQRSVGEMCVVPKPKIFATHCPWQWVAVAVAVAKYLLLLPLCLASLFTFSIGNGQQWKVFAVWSKRKTNKKGTSLVQSEY